MLNIIQKENELVRYLFDELSEEEAHEIEYMISENELIQELFEQLLEAKDYLSRAKIVPSDEVVQRILNYSSFISTTTMS